ncbi:ABC transporter ATP-binding protein [Vibrio sonorensis]|uniref:ABC transporter ATP-binding protein n=1 Tax=Vibrio sonorensis TaxID=1004316 RepID=UPI0008D98165|nr:ABC transporter ATP-binding protein [Vibrio sonorensis]
MFAEPVSITIEAGALTYQGNQSPTLANCDLTFPAGKWTCILGRSGCGKSSLLKHLAGLLGEQAIWQGEVTVNPDIHLPSNIAYMAQQDLLLPWLNVIENVCLSAKFGEQKTPNIKRAQSLLKAVGLKEYSCANIRQLSGGMRQRVALARTLMQDKPIVLMDEPFSALDAVNRYRLQTLFSDLLKDRTVVLITHDPQEAIRLADQLYLLHGVPAKGKELKLPDSSPPRDLNRDSVELQQIILKMLEADHE